MRNRKGNSFPAFFWILLFLIFFGLPTSGVTNLIFGSLLIGLLPILAIVFGGMYLAKKISNSNNDYKDVPYRTMVRSRYKNNLKVNRRMIDSTLSEYFKSNYKLKIDENISLIPLGGTYTTFNDLYLSINDELVSTLDEFGNNYPSTYKRLLKLLEEYSRKSDTSVIKKQEAKPKKIIVESKPLHFINIFNELNDQIPNEEISNQLLQTSDYLKKIDNSKIKDDDSKVNKLYEYYLPMLENILKSYIKLSNTNQDSDEFKTSEIELIKKTMLINEALRNVNNTIHSEDYLNINADMNVLESLLRKDGLVENELELKK